MLDHQVCWFHRISASWTLLFIYHPLSTTGIVFIHVADMTNQLQRVASFIGFTQIELCCVSTWIVSSWNHNSAVFTPYTVLLFLYSPVGPACAAKCIRGVGFRTDSECFTKCPSVPILRAVATSAKRPHSKSISLCLCGQSTRWQKSK